MTNAKIDELLAEISRTPLIICHIITRLVCYIPKGGIQNGLIPPPSHDELKVGPIQWFITPLAIIHAK